MIGLLKFLVILMVTLYFFRWISPFLLKYFMERLFKKMQQPQTEDQHRSPHKKSQKKIEEMGEYIDYEEID